MTLEEARDWLEEHLEEDLQSMQPAQRVNLYLNLMEFFTAKKQRTNIEDDKDQPIDIY